MRIPFTRASIDSILEVASISTTRGAFPGMPKLTEIVGKVREGASFTGSNGINASPTTDRHTNNTMTVNDDMYLSLFKSKFFYCPVMFQSNVSAIGTRFSKSYNVSFRILK